MKVYHYADIEDWRKVLKGSWKSRGEPGLGAFRGMGRADGEARETQAVFALLEPSPSSRVENEDFKGIWDDLTTSVGALLLELEVDLEEDRVFVVDRGHIEGFLYEDKRGIPKKYLHPSRVEGERAYMESKVPLKEYLKKADELKYSLPEVAILGNVPLGKIDISSQQPLLEDRLGRYGYELRQRLIKDIRGIPELSRWYEQYEHERELQGEGSLAGKLK